jgi:hypothetical protein
VFSIYPDGSLHMRYTLRSRSIRWNDDEPTRAAVALLESLLASDLPYILEHRLSPGQGVLCNNVLHTREGFQDDPATGRIRLYLRARFYDRIAGTTPEAPAATSPSGA